MDLHAQRNSDPKLPPKPKLLPNTLRFNITFSSPFLKNTGVEACRHVLLRIWRCPKDKSWEVLCAIWTCTRLQQVFLTHVLTWRSSLTRPSKSSYNLTIRLIKTYVSTITLCASAAPTFIYHQTCPGFYLLRFYRAIYWGLVLNNGRQEVRRGRG